MINGEVVASHQGHAWVDAGLLYAGRAALNDKDITQWFDKNQAIAQQVLTLYGEGQITART